MGGKKKKGGKEGGGNEVYVQFEKPPDKLFEQYEEKYCTVHVKLVTWSYLNMDINKVPISTNLYIIEQKIIQHHGNSIGQLTLWKDQVHPKNVLRDFSKTLDDIFQFDDLDEYPDEEENLEDSSTPQTEIEGDSKKKKPAPMKECVIYYDFQPHHSDCPLLLSSPRLLPLDDKK